MGSSAGVLIYVHLWPALDHYSLWCLAAGMSAGSIKEIKWLSTLSSLWCNMPNVWRRELIEHPGWVCEKKAGITPNLLCREPASETALHGRGSGLCGSTVQEMVHRRIRNHQHFSARVKILPAPSSGWSHREWHADWPHANRQDWWMFKTGGNLGFNDHEILELSTGQRGSRAASKITLMDFSEATSSVLCPLLGSKGQEGHGAPVAALGEGEKMLKGQEHLSYKHRAQESWACSSLRRYNSEGTL